MQAFEVCVRGHSRSVIRWNWIDDTRLPLCQGEI